MRTLRILPLIFLAASCHSAEHGALPSTTPIAQVGYNAVFVVNGGDSTVSVVNAETEEVAATIQVQNGSFPHHLYASSDRSTLALAIPGVDLSGGHDTGGGHGAGHGGEPAKGAVLILEATTGATRVARLLDATNHNAVYSPSGTEIWTSQMATSGTVLILDPTTLATRQSVSVGHSPAEITFSRDGRYAFVANGASDDVTVIDAGSKAVVKTIAVGDNPVGAWPASDGLMYVDNETGKSLSAIDVQTLSVVRTYSLGFTPAMAQTSQNGELWVTDTDNGKVVFFAAGSDMRIGEVATGAGAHAIAFSSDGQTAYVTNQVAGTLSIIEVSGKTIRKTLTVGSKPNRLLFRARS